MVKVLALSLPHPTLPEADWGDAYAVSVGSVFTTAREAGDAIVKAFPAWMYPLLVIRNILVSPFGLKGTKRAAELKPDPIGFFPVQSESTNEIVAGFDDRHLDFRLIITLQPEVNGQQVSLTTVVHRNNWLGRIYLPLVLPFHRAIIKSALRRLARQRG